MPVTPTFHGGTWVGNTAPTVDLTGIGDADTQLYLVVIWNREMAGVSANPAPAGWTFLQSQGDYGFEQYAVQWGIYHRTKGAATEVTLPAGGPPEWETVCGSWFIAAIPLSTHIVGSYSAFILELHGDDDPAGSSTHLGITSHVSAAANRRRLALMIAAPGSAAYDPSFNMIDATGPSLPASNLDGPGPIVYAVYTHEDTSRTSDWFAEHHSIFATSGPASGHTGDAAMANSWLMTIDGDEPPAGRWTVGRVRWTTYGGVG